MEPDLASEAAELTQAAPIAGADNEKEREKSALLEQMDGSEVAGEGDGHNAAPEPAPEAGVVAEETAEEDPAVAEVRRKAREAVARDFPEALTEGSELATACREELEYLREAGSPLADDPDAEYKIARRMSRLLGKQARPAVAEPAPKAAPRRSVRPIPTGGAPVESPATALERRVAGAKSTGDMLTLLREIGTPFEALLKR